MDPKLAMLILLIGTILSLSHLGRENRTGVKDDGDRQDWRRKP
jgi:hypothetical protein